MLRSAEIFPAFHRFVPAPLASPVTYFIGLRSPPSCGLSTDDSQDTYLASVDLVG